MTQNKKLSGYQKLKAKNEKLKDELYTLACDPESEKAIAIKMEWVVKAGIEKAIFAGDSVTDSKGGIREFMTIGSKKQS